MAFLSQILYETIKVVSLIDFQDTRHHCKYVSDFQRYLSQILNETVKAVSQILNDTSCHSRHMKGSKRNCSCQCICHLLFSRVHSYPLSSYLWHLDSNLYEAPAHFLWKDFVQSLGRNHWTTWGTHWCPGSTTFSQRSHDLMGLALMFPGCLPGCSAGKEFRNVFSGLVYLYLALLQ